MKWSKGGGGVSCQGGPSRFGGLVVVAVVVVSTMAAHWRVE